MKRKIFLFDSYLFSFVFVLSLIGLITFYSASSYLSLLKTGNSQSYFFDFFLKSFLLGYFFFLLGNFLGQRWEKVKPIFFLGFLVSYVFLILVFFPPFSLKAGEATRWINLKFFSFQPAEIIKPFALLLLSLLLGSNLKASFKTKIFLFLSFFLLVILPVFLEPSLSNSLILGIALFSCASVFFQSAREIFTFSISSLVIFLILILLGLSFWEYRQERIISFLTKGALHQERFFQLKQTTIAIASGGLTGKGLGKSQMKIMLLPQMLTDSIFAIYAEETGFLGSLVLIFFFVALFLRILILSFNNSSVEKKAFGLGVFSWLSLQTFLHLISNIGLFAPTGVVLPFFSLGASSQIAIYFSLGLLSSFKN